MLPLRSTLLRNWLQPAARPHWRGLASVNTPPPSPDRSAIVLLSGGLDSATVLALALSEGYSVTTLSFDYGQRHRHELHAAASQSSTFGAVEHRQATVDASIFRGGTSLMAGSSLPVPKNRMSSSSSSPSSSQTLTDVINASIPSTYVPARNTLFLSYALALAETLRAGDIFIGANVVDYSGYPDCRPEFFRAFQRVADLGTKVGVAYNQAPTVRVPLLHMAKKEIIETGLRLGVDYSLTHSCYDPGPNGRPCTQCDSCTLRADAFAQLGFTVDPAVERYQKEEAGRGLPTASTTAVRGKRKGKVRV